MSSPPSVSPDHPPTPDYNTPSPPSLFTPGLLHGSPILLDPSSISPLPGCSGIYTARLRPASEAREVVRNRGGVEGCVAVKVVEDDRTRVPRDGKREAELLGKLDHPNILAFLNAYLSPPSPFSSTRRLTLFTPLYPHSLRSLLSSLLFVPSTSGFTRLSHALAVQLFEAVEYLHERGVAHRDVGPGNVVLSGEGRAVLIDFGIAVDEKEAEVAEKDGERYFEVGTGSYRPPELLFGSRTYSPATLDLWSLATTISEFFTPFETPTPASRSSSASSEDSYDVKQWRFERTPPPPFDGGSDEEEEAGEKLQRKTLFQSGGSDFLLAGSIFRVLGTPTAESWPESASLPSFHRFTFSPFPPSLLIPSHLPHLDPTSPLVEILPRMLVVSAGQRMGARKAKEVMSRAGWGADGRRSRGGNGEAVTEGGEQDDVSLAELLASMLPS